MGDFDTCLDDLFEFSDNNRYYDNQVDSVNKYYKEEQSEKRKKRLFEKEVEILWTI